MNRAETSNTDETEFVTLSEKRLAIGKRELNKLCDSMGGGNLFQGSKEQ